MSSQAFLASPNPNPNLPPWTKIYVFKGFVGWMPMCSHNQVLVNKFFCYYLVFPGCLLRPHRMKTMWINLSASFTRGRQELSRLNIARVTMFHGH